MESDGIIFFLHCLGIGFVVCFQIESVGKPQVFWDCQAVKRSSSAGYISRRAWTQEAELQGLFQEKGLRECRGKATEEMDMLRELEQFYENYCENIREEADRLRAEEMPEITERLFAVYENTGNRLQYEEVYFTRRKFLAVFGLKAVLDREQKCIRKLEEVLKDICREECWALPAHVNRKENADWRIYIDLFAAETAQALAEISFLLRDVLSPKTVDMVRHEVMRRVLLPFYRSEAPYGGGWEYGTNNWCAVCGGSVGSAAIYLMQDRPEMLEAVLERTIVNVTKT